MTNEKKQDIVRRAVELVGHVELADELEVPSWVVEAWLCGGVEIPDSKLMDLAFVLLETSRPRVMN
jgi:hypothetical protein